MIQTNLIFQKILFRLIILATLFTFASSCGKGLQISDLATLSNNSVATATLDSITITAAGNATGVEYNQTLQFTAIGHYSDGTTKDITLEASWDSTLPANVSVNASTGLVTGISIIISAPFPAITATLEGVQSNSYDLSCNCPSGKRTFVTTASMDGNLGGIVGADAKCMADAQATGGTFKAMVVDGINRTACTSNNCSTGGTSEHVNWIFQPNTYYFRIDNSTCIGKTNSNGLLTTPLLNTYRDAVGTNAAFRLWTGLTSAWKTNADCSHWTAAAGIGGHSRLDSLDSQAVNYSTQNCSDSGNYILCVEQ